MKRLILDDSRRFEIKDEKIICSPLEFVPEPGGLGYEYFMAMKKHKNKVAQVISIYSITII